MSAQLKLVKRGDLGSDISSVNLLSYSAGFDIAYEGWTPRVGKSNDELVREAITLRAKGSSIDNLAAAIQSIAEYAQYIREAKDNAAERYALWLRAQLEGETGARQAYIHRLEHGPAASLHSRMVSSKYHLNEYTLGIERSPWWEDTSKTDVDLLNVPGFGTLVDLSSVTIAGDLPARIAQFKIKNNTVLAASVNAPWCRGWFGFRTNRHGTAANLLPAWRLSLGTTGTDTTTTADSDTKSGTRLTCAFTTHEDMQIRAYITLAQATGGSNNSDQAGRFMVLLRAAQSDATSVIRVRLAQEQYNNLGNTGRKYFSRVTLQPVVGYNGKYKFYELGVVNIPPNGVTVVNNAVQGYDNVTFYIYGERISGSGNLYLGELVLIPMLEGYVKGSFPVDAVNVTTTGYMYIVDRPDGRQECIGADDLGTGNEITYFYGDGQIIDGFPTGTDTYMVCAVQTATHSDITAGTGMFYNLDIDVYERWAELRGSE